MTAHVGVRARAPGVRLKRSERFLPRLRFSLCVAVLLLGTDCRRLSFCADQPELCDAPRGEMPGNRDRAEGAAAPDAGGDGPDGAGGAMKPATPGGATDAGGAGGAGGAGEDCPAPSADCDESSLNGCETDLLTSPQHCGSCQTPCNSFCLRGACVEYETLFEEVEVEMAPTRTAQYVYFVSSQLDPTGRTLQRLSRRNAEVESLLEGDWNAFEWLVAGPERVYFANWFGEVSSVTFGGSELRSESIDTSSLTSDDIWVYWVSEGALRRRDRLASTTDFESGPLLEGEGTLVGYPDPLYVLDNFADAAEPGSVRHRIYAIEPDFTLTLVAEGPGLVHRLRSGGATVYWLLEMPAAEGTWFEVRGSLGNGQSQVVASGPDLVDFALDDDHVVYVAYSAQARSGVRKMRIGKGIVADAALRFPATALDVFDGYLWFFTRRLRQFPQLDTLVFARVATRELSDNP